MDIIQKFVSNCSKSKTLFLLLSIELLVSGCCHDGDQPVANYYAFKQTPPVINASSNFTVCGNSSNPCAKFTPIELSSAEHNTSDSKSKPKIKKHKKALKQNHEILSVLQNSETTREKLLSVCKTLQPRCNDIDSKTQPSSSDNNAINTSLKNGLSGQNTQQNVSNAQPESPSRTQNVSVTAEPTVVSKAGVKAEPVKANINNPTITQNNLVPQNPYFEQVHNKQAKPSLTNQVLVIPQPQQKVLPADSNKLSNT